MMQIYALSFLNKINHIDNKCECYALCECHIISSMDTYTDVKLIHHELNNDIVTKNLAPLKITRMKISSEISIMFRIFTKIFGGRTLQFNCDIWGGTD